MKRLEIKGRGKVGIRKKYKAKMHVVLEEGMTLEEKMQKAREYKLGELYLLAWSGRTFLYGIRVRHGNGDGWFCLDLRTLTFMFSRNKNTSINAISVEILSG